MTFSYTPDTIIETMWLDDFLLLDTDIHVRCGSEVCRDWTAALPIAD
jgi:hypothetical protein